MQYADYAMLLDAGNEECMKLKITVTRVMTQTKQNVSSGNL